MKAGGNCIPSKPDLKLSRSVSCGLPILCYCCREVVPTSDGAGGKEYLYMFFEVAICLYLCSPLVHVSLLFKYVFGSIVTCRDLVINDLV
jgi:hypothetical protein